MEKKQFIMELKKKPCGAKFFKCALQVNSHSYARYRGLVEMDEDDYNKQILEKCLELKIEVVGIADHGTANESEKLRDLLVKNKVIVFPGFEVCSHEKVHIVCLFQMNYSIDKLNQILGAIKGGAIDDKEKTYPSKLSLLEIAKIVDEHKGVWYAAHITGDNGLLKLYKDGGGLKHIWIEEKYVLAGQIPGNINELEEKYKQILLNKNLDYKRINPISFINAKDIERPETLMNIRASCLIKMDTPTIEALRQAFLDGSSRIRLNDQLGKKYHSYIRGLKVDSSFFGEGLLLHFSPNLNTIIGGRGTGKSTILECIRYGLDLPYHSSNSKTNADEVLRQNLFGGKITLLIYSQRFEKDYIIERHYGQPVLIKDENGISNLTIKDILPGAELFGQNEIYEISNSQSYYLKLLNRFLPEENKQYEIVLDKLKQNRIKLTQVFEKIDDLESETNQLSRLKEQQKSFQELGLLDKFKEFDQYQLENARIITRSKKDINSIKELIIQIKEEISLDIKYLSTEAIKDLPNNDIFKKIDSIWKNFVKDIQKTTVDLENIFNNYSSKLNNLFEEWSKRYQDFQTNYENAINSLPDVGGKKGIQLAREYDQISRRVASIGGIEKDLIQFKKLKEQLEKERVSLLAELDDLLLDRFRKIEQTCKSLSSNKLLGKLKIECEKGKIRKQLEEFLKTIEGIGAKKVTWINDIDDLTIRQLSKDIKAGKETLLEKYKTHGLTNSVADSIVSINRNKLLEIEEIIFDDLIRIKLNVGTNGKPLFKDIQQLSSGQKCTAILHLLLLDNPDPLVVDQPEDNLDNAFIAENIVEELRQQKEKRQFFFSTHNANIPVFGDAEWIGVLEMQEQNSIIFDDSVGSIDKESLKPKVEEILEGGKRAFEIRRLKYGF